MNLDHLRTYIEVVKLGSLSGAARKLFLSQPAITFQLQSLEKELGFRLIDRDPHHFVMTPKGKLFYSFAEYVCQEYDRLLYNVDRVNKSITGQLSIVATPIIGEFIVPRIISEFMRQNPSINIDVKILDSTKIINEVSERNDSVGFCTTVKESDDLNYVKIGEDQMVLIVYPGHPLAIRKQVTISDLIGEQLILRAEPEGRKYFYYDILKRAGLDLTDYEPKIVLGTVAGVVSTVESKAGIALISTLAIKYSEAMGMVKVVKIKDLNLKHSLYFVHKKEGYADNLLPNFIQFMKDFRKNIWE